VKDRYIVQVTGGGLNLPQICPVCGEPANDKGTIPALSAKDREEAQRMASHPMCIGSGYYGGAVGSGYLVPARRLSTGSVSPFSIPACEKHALYYEEEARLSGPCSILSGILMIVAFFVGLSLIGSIALGVTPDFFEVVVEIAILLVIVITIRVGGPTKLEKAIKIVDMSEDYSSMTLLIRDRVYTEELLRLNPVTAKLISM
jgi:hypothetical protein